MLHDEIRVRCSAKLARREREEGKTMASKQDFLRQPVEHVDITRHNVAPLVDAMRSMAFSARDLARAADIYDRMLADRDCAVILCLAGSLISAGLKKVFVEMLRSNMADAIVATGANIVDQDFFEALGFRHYIADERLKAGMDDGALLDLGIDRIYDTLIDEEELRICDDTVKQIADAIEPRPYSSREFLVEMGAYLERNGCKTDDSIVFEAYRRQVPIFCPAFSDCSAGFGLIAHQQQRGDRPRVSIDSVKDFYELSIWKTRQKETGLFMVGGGVPKNFAQDITVAADIMGFEARMHKYAIQVTVADVRDGALSGSTLKEANSWGKVDTAYEQMVFAEATVAVPLIAGYAWHKGNWKSRPARQSNQILDTVAAR
jgi:deoxyhypusine synthase